MWHSQKAYQTEQLLQQKFFDSMFILKYDKITTLWLNDSLTFTFCVTLSNSISIWATLINIFFKFDAKLSRFMPYSQIAYQTDQIL